MTHLSLAFLGPFRVTLAGQPVSGFEYGRVRALLAYLAVESERAHPREALAGLLWPDWPEAGALQNLRHALANLRACIGDREADPPFLLISREALQFNPTSDYDLDTRAFAQLSTAGRSGAPDVASVLQTPRLEQALALYRGPFLEGFSLPDSAPFEEWQTLKREQYARQVLELLQALAAQHEQRGEYESAQRYAQRQLELDPLREEAHRQLMRALAGSGQRSSALAQYLACRRLLADELGVEPAAETTVLYEQMRQGKWEDGRADHVSQRDAASAVTEVAPSAGAPPSSAAESVLPPFPGEGRAPVSQEQPLPVVARERELAVLQGWLGLALAGQGRVGFVCGDPGSGKTTLLAEFARRSMAAHPDLVVAQGNGNAYTGQGDPYLPFLEMLQLLTGDIGARWAAGALTHEHVRRLWALVPEAAQALVEQAPELVELLVPGTALLERVRAFGPAAAPALARLEALLERKAASPASVQQGELFERVTRFLQALARGQPLLLLLDDLQWADEGSLNLLFHLGRKLAGQRLLVLGAYRSTEVALGRDGKRHPLEPVVNEFRRTWGENLLDMAEAEGRGLVEALLDQEPNRLGAGFRETLYRHTGGHALFTVELLRGLRARGDLRRDPAGNWGEGPELDWEHLPARVEAVIGESLGRLTEEDRALLAVASVEGEEFTAEVLAHVQGDGDARKVIARLSGDLSKRYRLVGAQSVGRVGEQRLSRYRFRHYLFQRCLYEGLDPVQRADLHERMGLALEALYGPTPRAILRESADIFTPYPRDRYRWQAGEAAAAVVPQLARHFEAAGLIAKAADYLQVASERACFLNAWDEGAAHMMRCAALLASLPDTPGNLHTRYAVHTWASFLSIMVHGNAAPEREPICIQACDMARQIGEAPLINEALFLLADYYFWREDLRQAMPLFRQGLESAERIGPSIMLPWYRMAIAFTLWCCGELAESGQRLEQMLAPYTLEQLPPDLSVWPSAALVALLATVGWYQGSPLRVNLKALAAVEPGAIVPEVLAFLPQLDRDVAAAQAAAEQVLAGIGVGEGHYQPRHECYALLLLGWVHAQSGRAEEGIAELRRGLDAYTATGARLHLSHFLAMLAEGYACAGRAAEGLQALREALEHVERTDGRYYEAELHRLRGELLLQQGAPDAEAEAEACFRRALEVARRQGARAWELRTSLSLARLWRRQGKREEAHALLAAIYGWFTEGFETADLREAKALLEELGE